MASVLDAAKYILSNMSDMTTYKLQKLVYYSQAWSVTINNQPLFNEAVRAWEKGPVVKELFLQHKGYKKIDFDDLEFGDMDNLTPEQKNIVDHVLVKYGGMSADELVELTHSEDPWKHADEEISLKSMHQYYGTHEPITKIHVPIEITEWVKTLPTSTPAKSA